MLSLLALKPVLSLVKAALSCPLPGGSSTFLSSPWWQQRFPVLSLVAAALSCPLPGGSSALGPEMSDPHHLCEWPQPGEGRVRRRVQEPVPMTPQPPGPHPRTLLSHCSVVFISQMCPKLNTEPVVESSFSWALLQRASTLRKALCLRRSCT